MTSREVKTGWNDVPPQISTHRTFKQRPFVGIDPQVLQRVRCLFALTRKLAVEQAEQRLDGARLQNRRSELRAAFGEATQCEAGALAAALGLAPQQPHQRIYCPCLGNQLLTNWIYRQVAQSKGNLLLFLSTPALQQMHQGRDGSGCEDRCLIVRIVCRQTPEHSGSPDTLRSAVAPKELYEGLNGTNLDHQGLALGKVRGQSPEGCRGPTALPGCAATQGPHKGRDGSALEEQGFVRGAVGRQVPERRGRLLSLGVAAAFQQVHERHRGPTFNDRRLIPRAIRRQSRQCGRSPSMLH
mmetsp:Transcript_118429/g.377491  ORF Transcript_118429/g.377491 Transcript_118429/m.377491 type:complete len:298 (+) Transcript_118429:589-1482(+)